MQIKFRPSNSLQVLLLCITSAASAAVTVPSPTTAYRTFDEWRAANFTSAELADSSISGTNADPEKDGRTNRLEYAFCLKPKLVEAGRAPEVVRNFNGTMSITFAKLTTSTDLAYVVEVTTDNVNWTSAATSTTSVIVGGNAIGQVMKYTSTKAAANIRLQVLWAYGLKIKALLQSRGLDPASLMKKCVIPSGPMQGAITEFPMLYPFPNYLVRWYFSDIGIAEFAADPVFKNILKNYITLQLARLESNYTIRDVDVYTPSYTIWQTLPADADDSNAGELIELACAYRIAFPTDPFFATISPQLKSLAYMSIFKSVKADNGLVMVFQNGLSAPDSTGKVIANSIAYAEDNFEAQIALEKLVSALQAIGDLPSTITYCAAFRDNIRRDINNHLWDNLNGAWLIADSYKTAERGPWYAALQCQYFPELLGFKHQSGALETARRYNLAWKWLNANMPNWWNANGWAADVNYSELGLAIVSYNRGEWQKAQSYVDLALTRWWPDSTVSTRLPLSSEIGYMQRLLNQ